MNKAGGKIYIESQFNNTPLFKYMDTKFAKHLEKFGKLRVGTLFGYRSAEEKLRDKREGEKTVYCNDDVVEFRAGEQHHSFFDDIFKLGTPGEGELQVSLYGTGGNIRIIKQQNSPNFHIVCLSSSLNRSLMKKLGYNACIQISDVSAFCGLIAIKLRNIYRVGFDCAVREVEYKLRDEYYQNSTEIHSALIKEEEYSEEREVRIIFVPQEPLLDSSPLQPFQDIRNKEIPQYIRRVM